MWESVEYDREELYERVWNTPMYKLAEEEGMSDRGLAKICKKLEIPRPPRGYWQKLRAGKDVEVAPLPERGETTPQTHRRRVYDRRDTTSSDGAQELRDAHADAPPITVAAELDDPHPLVAMSLEYLRSKDPGSASHTPHVRIHASSPEARERAIRIMDALLKGLEIRGIELEVTEPICTPAQTTPSMTNAKLLGQAIPFSLVERSKRHTKLVETKYSRMSDVFSPKKVYEYEYLQELELRTHVGGDLGFQGLRQTWADGKRQRVEDCLNEFVTGMITLADRLWRREQKRKHVQAQRRAEEAARKNQTRQSGVNSSKALQQDLDRRLAALDRSRQILELLKQLEARHTNFRETYAAWVKWVENLADKQRRTALETKIPEFDSLDSPTE